MAQFPYADPSIDIVNASATQLYNATRRGYGGLPNPQLAVDAIQTGASPAVAQLATEQNPQFASLLTGVSIGGREHPNQKVPVPQYASDVMTMDQNAWQQYWKDNGDDKEWKGSGLPKPIPNVQWYNTLSHSGDTATIKRLQSFLNGTAFGYVDPKDEHRKLDESGIWDEHTDQAYRSFLIARFMPVALYAKADTERNRANLFLNNLGFDANAVAGQLERSDKAKYNSTLTTRWLSAHGPGVEQRDSIDEYANTFGTDHMPEEIAHLRSHWWDKLADTIRAVDPLTWGSPSPGEVESKAIGAKLNDAERALLQPSLDQAAHSHGYLGFLDAWDRLRAHTILSAKFFLEDAAGALTGHGADNINPFDPGSDVSQKASKYENDLAAGLFGDRVGNFPVLGTLLNFTANVADDPLTYIPAVGEVSALRKAGRLGEAAEQLTRADRITADLSRLPGNWANRRLAGRVRLSNLGPRTIHDAYSRGGLREVSGRLMSYMLTPLSTARFELADALGGKDLTWVDRAMMLGEAVPEEKLDHLGALATAPTVSERLRLLNDHFPHAVADVSHLANYREFSRSLSPKYFELLSQGKQMSLLHMGHLADTSTMADLTRPYDFAKQLQETGIALEMDQKQVRAYVEAVYRERNNPTGLAFIGRAFNDQVDGALSALGVDPDRYWKHVEVMRGRRAGLAPEQLYAPRHDPGDPLAGDETSYDRGKYQFPDDDQGRLSQAAAEDLMRAIDGFRQTLKDKEEALFQQEVEGFHQTHGRPPGPDETRSIVEGVRSSPEFRGDVASISDRIAPIRRRLDDLAQPQVRIAAYAGQAETWFHFKTRPYEVLSYRNPVLRNADWLQRKSGFDHAMNIWRRVVLSSPATTYRIALSDESLRVAAHLGAADPVTGVQYLMHALGNKLTAGRRFKTPEALPPKLQAGMAKFISDHFMHSFGAMWPTEEGYAEALTHFIEDVVAPTRENRVWVDAMKASGGDDRAAIDALAEFIKSDHPDAQKILSRRAGKQIDDDRAHAIATYLHHERVGLTAYRPDHTTVFDWVDRGKVNQDELRKLLEAPLSNPYKLPVISYRRSHVRGSDHWLGGMGHAMETYRHYVLDRAVNKARERGRYFKILSEEKRLRRGFGDRWTEDEIRDQATANADAWVLRNTYVGVRSLTGSAFRSVAPFWGATANMNRYWLRFMREHPAAVDPFLRGVSWAEQQNQQGGLHLSVPLVSGILRHAGFSAGDEFTVDPTTASFVTREGLGGFVPGAGPLFNVGVHTLGAADPELVTALKQVPGLQYLDASSPIAGPLSDLLSGVGLATVGKPFAEGVPVLGRPSGYYEKRVDQKLAQQQAQEPGRTPDVGAATAEVGREQIVQGATRELSPARTTVDDQQRVETEKALRDQWDRAVTDAQRSQVIAQRLGVPASEVSSAIADGSLSALIAAKGAGSDPVAMMAYFDSRVSRSDKQQLVAASPWLVPYSVGTHRSATDAQAPARFQQDVDSKGRPVLPPEEFLAKMQKYQQFDTAFAMYDDVEAFYHEWLLESGVSPTGRQAASWRKQNLDPVVEQIAQAFPEWRDQFLSKQQSRSVTGLQARTAPLSSLMAFEVIPQSASLEGPSTKYWRALLVRRDQATTALNALIANRRTNAEKQQVLSRFAQEVRDLVDQDSTGELRTRLGRFTYSQLEDLVSYRAEASYA